MNIKRFFHVLLWQLAISRRQLITFALVFFGIIVIPQIFGLILNRNANTTDQTAPIVTIGLCAYLLLGGATFFTHLKSRQERINEFMLPASNQEKFIARYLIHFIIIPLVAIPSFLAGDLVQHLLTLTFGLGQEQWATSSAVQMIKGMISGSAWTDTHTVYTAIFVFCLISLHASFIFLGSIFHKQPAVMAVLSWIVISMLILMTTALAAGLVDLTQSGYVIILYDNWFNAALILLNILFIAFCFWFAYRKYTRLQVINNKWLNK